MTSIEAMAAWYAATFKSWDYKWKWTACDPSGQKTSGGKAAPRDSSVNRIGVRPAIDPIDSMI
jgi:hypothetical protein